MRKLLKHKSQSFTSPPPAPERSFSFCYEFTPEDKNSVLSRGILFLVAEGWADEAFDSKIIISLIIDSLYKHYYKISDQPPLICLEQSLINLRQIVFDYVADNPHLKASSFSFNITAGVLWNNIFYISLLGDGAALIFKESSVEKIIPRTDSYLTSASGQISQNDAVLLCSGSILENGFDSLADNGLGTLSTLLASSSKKQLGVLLIKFEVLEVLETSDALRISPVKKLPKIKAFLKKLSFNPFRTHRFRPKLKSVRYKKKRSLLWFWIPVFAAVAAIGWWAISSRRQSAYKNVIDDFLNDSGKVIDQARQLIGINNSQARHLIDGQLQKLDSVLGATSSSPELLSRQQELEDLKDSTYSIIRFKSAPVLAGLPANILAGKIAQVGDSLVVFDYDSAALYVFSLPDGLLTQQLLADSFEKSLVSCDSDNCWFLKDTQLLTLKYPTWSLSASLLEETPFQIENTVALTHYFGGVDFFYTVTPSENNVYKGLLSKENSNFSYWSSWFVEEVDLTGANSLAVDGNLYIGYKNGQVARYYSGSLTTYSLENTPGGLNSLDKVFTGADYNYLYVLDSENSRVLVYDKRGGDYVKQCIIESSGPFLDFFVEKGESNFFILTAGQVLSIPLFR